MLNAGFRLSTYSCRYTVQECVKLGCLIDKASKLLCVWVCVTPKQKQIWSRSERSQNNVSLCVRVYAYVWSCVCREISKYYGRFCCMFTSWISVYVCTSTLYVWEPPPLKIYRGSSHVVPTPTCLLEDTLARLCITNMRTLPQVSVCVIWRGITLWRDHTGDSFQLSKHHIKNTHALTDTHTHIYACSTGYSLLASLLRNWEKLPSIKTCWHHLDS